MCENDDVKCLFKDIELHITGGAWRMRATDETWCSNFKFALEDIQKYMFKFLIESQFSNLFGQNVETLDICRALTTKTMNQQLLLSDFYSREVGLAGRTGDSFGQYPMEKDFVLLKDNVSFYEIPKGRQILDVLWIEQPSFVDAAIWSNMWSGFNNNVLSGGIGMGSMSGFWGGGSYAVFPIYDTLLRMQNFSMKDRMLHSELLYKIRAGYDGKKILELLSIPGGDEWSRLNSKYNGCKLWYTYYDVTSMSEEQRNECIDKCKSIIKYPSDVPLSKIDYCDFNPLFKTYIRNMFLVHMLNTEARIIGRFGGVVPVPEGVDLKIEYSMLIDEAMDIKKALNDDLTSFMNELLPHNQSEKLRKEVENTEVILAKNPLGLYVF